MFNMLCNYRFKGGNCAGAGYVMYIVPRKKRSVFGRNSDKRETVEQKSKSVQMRFYYLGGIKSRFTGKN